MTSSNNIETKILFRDTREKREKKRETRNNNNVKNRRVCVCPTFGKNLSLQSPGGVPFLFFYFFKHAHFHYIAEVRVKVFYLK